MTTAATNDTSLSPEAVRGACEAFRSTYASVRAQISRVIVGQDMVVDQLLTALFADGHVLLEGVPGLGKTLLVRTLSESLSLPFQRIQFTPDLMPADITGTNLVIDDPETGHRSIQFRRGPIFSQLVLADEINRATPKSQAALLEAMQERSVTVGGETFHLTRPFFVMATQNPVEQEGTHPLPEAQLDRFLFKVIVPYTTRAELGEILTRTTQTGIQAAEPVLDGAGILAAQRLARCILAAPHVQDFAVRLVLATHPTAPTCPPDMSRYISFGASPRGAQALIAAAKVRALMDGRFAIAFTDIESVARPALRHRLLCSFEAQAEGVCSDDIVDQLLRSVPRDSPSASEQTAPWRRRS